MGEIARAGTAAVLIVDDHPAMRIVCRVNLELDGFRVFESGTVEEAEQLLNDESVGVVVTDVQLVGARDGLGFARRVRADHPGVGLVVMTGSVPAPEELLDFADAAFTKPFDVSALVDAVARLAHRRSSVA